MKEDVFPKNMVPASDDSLCADKIVRRIEQLGELHQRLSSEGGATDLAKDLRDIAQSAVASFGIADRTRLSFDLAQDCVMPARTAAFVGLAVNELVMNAIRYAHPTGITGQLSIGCSRRDGAIVVDIADDGVGLPEGFDLMTGGGFGLKLARSIAEQLNARLDITDTGTGLHVQLRIPA